MTTRAALVAEARTWLGTPYHHHGRVKGVGVDCAMLLAEVFERCGVAPRIEPGAYAHDWHLHRSEEVFLEWVESTGARQVQQPQPGDVAVFRFGRTYSHGAIFLDDGLLAHAYIGLGVIASRLTEDPLEGRPVLFYSLLD